MALIINADDFGLTEGVCAGILSSMHAGSVSSTSAMMCRPKSVPFLERHAGDLNGRCGVHLQLTDGVPVLPADAVPSLAQPDGRFPRRRSQLRSLSLVEIVAEFTAQIEAFRSTGLIPTHIDTHQHVHKDEPVLEAYAKVALAYGLPARSCSPRMTARLRAAGVDCPDVFEFSWTASRRPAAALLCAIDAAFASCGGDGCVEVMCHPGRADAELAEASTLIEAREADLAGLCDPTLREGLFARGIALAPMSVLRRPSKVDDTV